LVHVFFISGSLQNRIADITAKLSQRSDFRPNGWGVKVKGFLKYRYAGKKEAKMIEEEFFDPGYITNEIADITGLYATPDIALSSDEKDKLLSLEDKIKRRIIGQDAAITAICRAIKRNKIGFKDPLRPVGSFIFLGTSGVGKTELCRALAEVLYGDAKKLIKIDMSEYMERWEATRLIGAAPGYTGHDNGGQLTNIVKNNPEAVLCLDEIEKAHPDIFNIFLQIMEDGVLTSSKGEAVSFKDILIIMTSNIGSGEITHGAKPIGFSGDYSEETDIKVKITAVLKKTFKPEFLNRLDEIITFNRLTEKDILQVCKIMLKKVKSKARKIGIKVDFDRTAVVEIARLGFSKEYGARPLRRVVSAKIEDMLADKVLAGELNAGDDIHIVFNKKSFAIAKRRAVQVKEMTSKMTGEMRGEINEN